MKITSSLDILSTPDLAAPTTARASVAQAVASPATEKVDLSAAGETLMKFAAGTGDFDSAKVDAIRAAIRGGQFKVDAGAIADRLIADAQSLLRPRTS